MNYVIPLWSPPAVPVTNSNAAFPVRRIYCVGRNYADHAREMGGNPDREPPFFFCKPADAVVPNGATLDYPSATQDFQHEIELVVAIGKKGSHIDVEGALSHVFGYAIGLDLTRRDLQSEAKALRRPWDTGKGFDDSAPVTPIHPVTSVGHPAAGAIWLKVNGQLRQQGDLQDMIWSVAEIISSLSRLFTLRPGDLVFTGTPAGVGPIQAGDYLQGGITHLGELSIRIAKAAD